MLVATVVLVALLAGTGAFVATSGAEAKAKLRDRFIDRTESGATFVGVYMKEMLARESRIATRYLSGDVSPKRMRLITETFDSAASVLLDHEGKLLAAFPHDRELISTDVGSKYPHLSTALTGTPAISPVVMSAVEGIPVVGAAAPFETRSGRRVFSAALSISGTPLKQYLDTMLPIEGADSYLVDSNGARVIAEEKRTADAPAALEGASGSGVHTVAGREIFFVSRKVPGTPWTIVGGVPTGSLYAPLEKSRMGAWGGLALLAALGVASLIMFARYTLARLDYKYGAQHCPLTGLANRQLLKDHTDRELSKLDRSPGSAALLYIDLDEFKSINDTLGHDAGDQLLREVAARLLNSLRPYDVVARIGGDEFAVLLPDIRSDDVEELAARVLFALEQPYELAGHDKKIGASAGVAVTETSCELEELLQKADAAMYTAKLGGKGRYHVASSGPRLQMNAGGEDVAPVSVREAS